MSPKITDEQRELRRLQVLHAAKRVFAEKGYGATTLKDIVEETGMSRGWIYLYYNTKEEIFEALMNQQDLEHEQYIKELLARMPSVWEVLRELFDQQHNELFSYQSSLLPAFYEYFLTGWRDGGRRELLVKRYEDGIARFAQLLQSGMERGEFRPSMSPFDISRLAAAYQEGIITHTIAIGPERANTRLQLDALIRYLKQLLNPLESE
jgi:AcrR family transcriptional regulator